MALAELHRLQGEVFLAEGGSSATALEAFERAVTIAHEQQAKSFELRAVMSIARVWQQQGRGADAYVRLAEIYGWFTEGHAMPDLIDARTLLDTLRA